MEPLLIPIVAILMPLFLVPTILVLKHRHKKREWEHRERMKAMETPFHFPQVLGLGSSRGVAAIGAGVPMASVLAAFLTSITWEPTSFDEVPVPAVAWGCAVLISAGALVTSLQLASMHAKAAEKADSIARMDNAKPAFDPDTFDVVGSRG
jgi:hypothetical protein